MALIVNEMVGKGIWRGRTFSGGILASFSRIFNVVWAGEVINSNLSLSYYFLYQSKVR